MKKLIHNVQQKTNIAVFIAYLFFAILTSFILSSIRSQYSVLIESSTRISEEISQKSEFLHKINQNTSFIHIHVLQFKLDSTLAQKRVHKNAIDSTMNKNSGIIRSLKKFVSDPVEKILFQRFQRSHKDYSLSRDNYLLLTLINYPIKDPEANYKQVRIAFENFKAAEKDLIDYENDRFIETSRKSTSYAQETGHTIELVLIGFIIISFLFSFVSLKLFTRLKHHYRKLKSALEEKDKATDHATSILNALPAHIALLDKTGKIVEVNASWKTFLGENEFVNKYIVGADFVELLENTEGENVTDQVAFALREMLNGKMENFSILHPIILQNQKRWFKVIANKENEKKDSGIIIMYLDITDKQEAEEKSKQAEARLIEFNKNSQDVICSISAEGNFIHISSASASIWGYEPAELRGKNFKELVHADDLAITSETALKIIAGNPVTMFENRYVRKDGSVVPMLWSARWKEDEKTMYCIARDASEKKKTEQELRNAEANYREIFEKASNGILILNAENGEIMKANQKSCEITGLDKDQLLNRSISDLDLFKYGTTGNELDSRIKQAFAGEDQIFELEIQKQNNTRHWIEVICTKANIAGISRILVFFNQIDLRKHVELTNARITADLVRRNLHLQEFAYIVSHNLRSPVSSILGLSNILKSTTSAEEKEKIQNYLFNTVEKLDEITKDLNYILEMRSEITKTKEPVDLTKLVNTIKSNFENKFDADKFDLSSDFSEIDALHSLKTYLHSIFNNLISNSIIYKKPNEKAVIEIQGQKIGNKIRISFKDNGRGIDLHQHGSKLFGLYNRFHSQPEGKGMGLFLVKNQVETLGGNIFLSSIPGKGTEIVVELPIN